VTPAIWNEEARAQVNAIIELAYLEVPPGRTHELDTSGYYRSLCKTACRELEESTKQREFLDAQLKASEKSARRWRITALTVWGFFAAWAIWWQWRG
jgi:hypothetical protein